MNLAQKLLGGVGGVAIVSGGIISAFLPDQASSYDTWLVAYLVLVVGVAQIIIGWGLSKLPAKKVAAHVYTIFLAFNFGNWLVASGTLISDTLLVYVGGAMICFAMFIGLAAIRGASRTPQLYAYIFMVAIILVSTPIGLVLSTLNS